MARLARRFDRRELLGGLGGVATLALAACAATPQTTRTPVPTTALVRPTVLAAVPIDTPPTSVPASPTGAPTTPAPTPATPTAAPGSPAGPARLIGMAFNAAGKDVTLFDPAARRAIETRPLGATVTWLSNEQRYWDGRLVWTFDTPAAQVDAIGIDPTAVSIARRIATGGKGPAHSLMLTADRKTAWVNAAGSDLLAVLDIGSGQVVDRVTTGAFP